MDAHALYEYEIRAGKGNHVRERFLEPQRTSANRSDFLQASPAAIRRAQCFRVKLQELLSREQVEALWSVCH